MTTPLDEASRTVADAFLERESRKRRHVVVALSGAHAYGFPSPDSDLDLKAIHVVPTRAMLALDPPGPHHDVLETIDGIEIDYTANELGPALAGILAGNGNYVERCLGALILRTSPEHDELVPLCRRALSNRIHRHYRGFAKSQYDAVVSDPEPAAKGVLYVLRTALTGTHLLGAGEIVVDVTRLLDEYGHGDAHELVRAKLGGERTRLDAAAKERWVVQLQRALRELDEARERSCLPDEPPNRAELNDWLVETRRRLL